jgi:hypothetical protein
MTRMIALVVIASEAKQSIATGEAMDCFVAYAPRNDDSIGLVSWH